MEILFEKERLRMNNGLAISRYGFIAEQQKTVIFAVINLGRIFPRTFILIV
jgi:hypothetical protein